MTTNSTMTLTTLKPKKIFKPRVKNENVVQCRKAPETCKIREERMKLIQQIEEIKKELRGEISISV